MREQEAEDICRKVDKVLDVYFDELADRLERKKDLQNLMGWLRFNLHVAITKREVSQG